MICRNSDAEIENDRNTYMSMNEQEILEMQINDEFNETICDSQHETTIEAFKACEEKYKRFAGLVVIRRAEKACLDDVMVLANYANDLKIEMEDFVKNKIESKYLKENQNAGV